MLFECVHILFNFRENFFFHMIDEQDTVQVIDFVLDTAGQKPIAFKLMLIAVKILITNNN